MNVLREQPAAALVLVLLIPDGLLRTASLKSSARSNCAKRFDNEWLLILAGALSVIFGLMVLVAPGAGALALIWVIAAYSIVFGAMLVGLSLRLRKHRHTSVDAAPKDAV